MPSAIEVRKVPIHSVADASELTRLIDEGVMAADRVVAIIGKTEGNGGVNDYTRIIADRAFREILVDKGADPAKVREIPIVWSGGTDGVISPHATVFATVPPDRAEQTDEPRLTVGFAMSEHLLPEEIGYTPMIRKVADAVKVAMERAGITDPADVHYVQTKTPLLTIHTIRDAKSRGKTVWTEHTHESMDLSNGCTALGIAVALGEIEMPSDEDVMHDRSLFSAVAILFVQMLYVTMVYGPIAAYLVEAFPAKIRYTALSLPYHIGNGVFGGLLPLIGVSIVARTGDIYAGLYYPIAVALLTFVVGSLLLRETHNTLIWDETRRGGDRA